MYLQEIAYSQSSVDDRIFAGDGEGAPVKAWKDEEPYTIPIDVVVIDSRGLCTLDNRRLYAAKNFSPPGYQMVFKRHNFSDIVSEEKLETGAGDVIFWWAEPDGLVFHLHVLEITLIHWGLLASYRCACQSPTFDLSGTLMEPVVCRYQKAFVPYYKARGIPNLTQKNEAMINGDGITNLRAAIVGGKMVGFSRYGMSRIMHRDAFNDMILLNLAGLRVTSYKKVENQTLELRVEGEKYDDYWQDQEQHQLECIRMDEMERHWIESDLAEV